MEFVEGESWPIQCGAQNVEARFKGDVQKYRKLPLGWQCILFAQNEKE